MVIKIVNKSNNPLPKYESSQAAGMDLRTSIDEPVTLQPLERKLFPTGLFLELPAGYEAQVRPRSGLAMKHGITVLNSPGTIDADYRGEVMVILHNHGTQNRVIQNGDRIAQIVFMPYVQADFIETDELSDTSRGVGGFGHTGR